MGRIAKRKQRHSAKCSCGEVNDSSSSSRCRKCLRKESKLRRSKGTHGDRRKNHRTGKGDKVCTCTAYSHPHRQFGGRCRPIKWVKRYFQPHRKYCRDCNCLVRGECQVATETETVFQCPALRAFVNYYEIMLYGKAKADHDRSVKGGHW